MHMTITLERSTLLERSLIGDRMQFEDVAMRLVRRGGGLPRSKAAEWWSDEAEFKVWRSPSLAECRMEGGILLRNPAASSCFRPFSADVLISMRGLVIRSIRNCPDFSGKC